MVEPATFQRMHVHPKAELADKNFSKQGDLDWSGLGVPY
jgi:hypothetical protein